MMELFERSAGDGIRVRFPEGLASFLEDVPRVLASVGSDPEDPAAERLAVPVYLDDPEANAEYWRWMGVDLDEGRRADRSAFGELVAAATVTDERGEGTVASLEEAHAFLRVLVEVRLVLASRMGVQVEADYDDLDDMQADVLSILGELQVLLIRTLSA